MVNPLMLFSCFSRFPSCSTHFFIHYGKKSDKGELWMSQSEQKGLEYAISEITEIATGFGLDFYPMRYEICPADIIYTFGAYGMPTRFNHWSFGKTFYRMKLQYDLGLSKIYELV